MIFSRKPLFFLALLLFSALPAWAQRVQTREEYIDRYKSIAVDHMERYGIPASITLAQGILESDCGNSWLSMQSNNHFGIKCKRDWRGDKVYYDDDAKGECFRSYPSVEASYEDHARFLDTQPRYDSLFAYAPTDYRSWARGLKAAGYATAPDYAQRLVRIIEESDLYLLDREGGEVLYSRRHAAGSGTEEWFAGQSSVERAATLPGGVDADNYRVTINAHDGYNVYRTNTVSYVLAHEGDTYERIGKSFRVSARNLRKFNDVERGAQPLAGEVVYIAHKRNRWQGNAMTHTVSEGETLFSIGQSYGIRAKALARMNKLRGNHTALTAGQQIRIR